MQGVQIEGDGHTQLKTLSGYQSYKYYNNNGKAMGARGSDSGGWTKTANGTEMMSNL